MEEICCLSESSEDTGTLANKTDESSTEISDNNSKSNSEHDFKSLRTKLYLLEHSLEEQRVTCNYLREERDEAVTRNRLLKREVEELHREVYTGKTRSSPELQQHERSGNYDTGMMTHSLFQAFVSNPHAYYSLATLRASRVFSRRSSTIRTPGTG